MQGDVQVGGRAEALDEGDGTGGGLIALLVGLCEEKRGNRAMDDLWIKSSCVSSQNNGDTDALGWDTSPVVRRERKFTHLSDLSKSSLP